MKAKNLLIIIKQILLNKSLVIKKLTKNHYQRAKYKKTIIYLMLQLKSLRMKNTWMMIYQHKDLLE